MSVIYIYLYNLFFLFIKSGNDIETGKEHVFF